jgi:hypothetical protein
MMISGAEDLQSTDEFVVKIENVLRNDRMFTTDELSAMFPQNLQISATQNHHRNPRISKTVCEVGPKTPDRPT